MEKNFITAQEANKKAKDYSNIEVISVILYMLLKKGILDIDLCLFT